MGADAALTALAPLGYREPHMQQLACQHTCSPPASCACFCSCRCTSTAASCTAASKSMTSKIMMSKALMCAMALIVSLTAHVCCRHSAMPVGVHTHRIRPTSIGTILALTAALATSTGTQMPATSGACFIYCARYRKGIVAFKASFELLVQLDEPVRRDGLAHEVRHIAAGICQRLNALQARRLRLLGHGLVCSLNRCCSCRMCCVGDLQGWIGGMRELRRARGTVSRSVRVEVLCISMQLLSDWVSVWGA